MADSYLFWPVSLLPLSVVGPPNEFLPAVQDVAATIAMQSRASRHCYFCTLFALDVGKSPGYLKVEL